MSTPIDTSSNSSSNVIDLEGVVRLFLDPYTQGLFARQAAAISEVSRSTLSGCVFLRV